MSSTTELSPSALTLRMLPFAAIVFLAYAAVGLPLSALPLEVNGALGFGTVTVGAVMGLAPAATLLTRQFAGRTADRRGPKLAVIAGLVTVALSGVAYLVATLLPRGQSLDVILLGRVLLGLGDSLATTGIAAWMVTRFGPAHAGRCMAWVGIAMYGALGIGAPIGAFLAAGGRFVPMAVAVVVLPLLGLPIAAVLPGLPPTPAAARVPMLGVLRDMWPPGLAMVLASSGFGTIAAFLALRFAASGWAGAGLALTAFGAAYILARLFLAGLPDRLGGSRVAVVCLVIEAAGLLLIGYAASPALAIAGTALTGLGYSMVFPALGVETVRRVPAASRGVALGTFLACFDLGVGAAGPLAGLVASGYGLGAAFTAAAVAALAGMGLTVATRR